MRLLIAIILCSQVGFAFEPADSTHGIFTKAWAYPDLPDAVIIKALAAKHSLQDGVDSIKQFENINGMACDKHDNLYVWDEKPKQKQNLSKVENCDKESLKNEHKILWKFSSAGKVLFKKNFYSGSEKGCINTVMGALAVSDDGLICLGDFVTCSVTILDSNGNFINRFNTIIKPVHIAFGKDNSIYVTGFEMLYNGPLIYHFSPSGTFLGKFCERDKISDKNKFTGNTGRLFVDSDGIVYYAFSYPYRIAVFLPDGAKKQIIERDVDYIKAPEKIVNIVDTTKAKYTHYADKQTSGLNGITVWDNKYLAVISYSNFYATDWNIDILDRNGKFIFSIPNGELLYKFSICDWSTDTKGCVYFNIKTNVGNMIVKYKINFNKFKLM
jgi:hypothetical protein